MLIDTDEVITRTDLSPEDAAELAAACRDLCNSISVSLRNQGYRVGAYGDNTAAGLLLNAWSSLSNAVPVIAALEK